MKLLSWHEPLKCFKPLCVFRLDEIKIPEDNVDCKINVYNIKNVMLIKYTISVRYQAILKRTDRY